MKAIAAALLGLLIIAQKPTAQDIREQLNAYLTTYEPRLSALIADESMTQRNVRGDSRSSAGVGPRELRTIKSEVAFIALPGDAGWMGFRRALKVDN